MVYLQSNQSIVIQIITKNMKLLLGILLPPVGIFLTYGVGPTLFINIGLTLLGWIPGSIHAVWAISKRNEMNREGTL